MPVAFESDHPNPDDAGKLYGSYKSTYYQSMDPRAFKWDTLTPEERRSVVDNLGAPSTKEKPNPTYDKFARSYDLAKKAGSFTLGAASGQ
jgi:hypothetical protein